MKRRTFLQSLFGLPLLATLRPPAVASAQTSDPQTGLTYSDSDGTPSDTLRAALADGVTDSGGMSYAA